MKPTILEQVQKMLDDLIKRQKMLEDHTQDYTTQRNYLAAHDCQTKKSTLDIVRVRLEDILHNN